MEHALSNCVEQLNVQVEEVAKEVAKVQQMVKTLQDKVHNATELEPTPIT